jgi:uncharacterized protein (UPF0548 family)
MSAALANCAVPPDAHARRALADLAHRPLNFDLVRLPQMVRAGGWHQDHLREPLGREAPGEPVPGGPWEQARRVMIDYQSADPAIVRAIFDPTTPLAGRDMLLQVRFGFLRLHAGVRVGDVYEDERDENGHAARVSGWNYRTLAGHFEQGEMAYEVWKWLDSGDVEFHIRAVSKVADSGNPLVRLGFRLIGRRRQLRFYRSALARMAALVRASMRGEV